MRSSAFKNFLVKFMSPPLKRLESSPYFWKRDSAITILETEGVR